MKLLVRIAVVLGVVVLASAAALFSWLYWYTADLPSVTELYSYNPAASSEVHTGDDAITHVIPGDQMNKYLLMAVVAAEGQTDTRDPIRATIGDLLSDARPHGQKYSWQVARGLTPPSHLLRHQIDELRLAEQIHRRFTQQQVLVIYLNRAYFGENTYGVEDASIRYFSKHAANLSLDEAALIAGLIRSPSNDSPIKHPERALNRRNLVIDQMVSHGSISRDEGEQAKSVPLIVKQTANSEAAYDWNRCALRVVSYGPPNNNTIRLLVGEKSTGQAPVIGFEILESGEVRNAAVRRSSGISEIDNYALSGIQNMRYKERPKGCGIIENQAAVNVDF